MEDLFFLRMGDGQGNIPLPFLGEANDVGHRNLNSSQLGGCHGGVQNSQYRQSAEKDDGEQDGLRQHESHACERQAESDPEEEAIAGDEH